MLKLSKLLFSSTESDVFINRIKPSDIQRDLLVNAKNDIRDYLKPRIQAATISVLGMEKSVTPRFRTQGSWSYKTCVQPAWQPPQEIDWDFGVFLPISVWEEYGPPDKMARLYFNLVEDLLQDLCTEKGWTLIDDNDNCIRVRLNSWAHIDIPLYAAPEAQFVQISEKAALKAVYAQDSRDALIADFGELDISQQQWEDMTDIMLATRSGLWKESDPEAVSKWYLDRVVEHTEQLRRVCLYLKAWRDFTWKNGDGPTSVCIMIAVAQNFEYQNARDDIALEKAARSLAMAISGDIKEIAIDDGIEDFNRLDPVKRVDASIKAQALASAIQTARMKTINLAQDVVSLLQCHLGNRIPDRADLVESDSGADSIRLVGAERVSRPIVKATSAG